MELKPKADTILEVLLSLEDCTRYGARFVSKGEEPTYHTYEEIIKRAKSVAGTLQAGGLEQGDRVAIILPTSIRFLDVFLGTQLAGGIPSALYPPVRLGRLAEYFGRTRRMLEKIGTRYLVTDSRIKKLLGPAVEDVECLEGVLNVERLLTGAKWKPPKETDPDTPAFLQFSSGTTVEPKAVTVSHTNLLFNLEMMESVFRDYSEEYSRYGGVCWLPLYHDMGLVGCMYNGLYHPGNVNYISPEIFIARPRIWLRTLSKYRSVISPAPDFAYGLCLKKVKDKDMEGVDLSNWEIALNGAEPINTEGLTQFSERFSQWGFRAEAMTPVYGLAEAGLAVSFSDFRAKPVLTEFDSRLLGEQGKAAPGKGRVLPSVGPPLPGVQVELRDEEDRSLPEGWVGRIMVRGPSITKGFYNDLETTSGTIRDGWLDTGDLGFLHEGNLYIAGRAKDLIIIRGRNYAPQEIEELIQDVDGLRLGCAIAVSHMTATEGEQMIVLAEKEARSQRTAEEIAEEIQDRVVTGISLTPYHVQILDPGTLPRTSSGKMRRAGALDMFLSGELLPPEKMGVLKMFKEVGKSQIAWGRFWLNKRRGDSSKETPSGD
jgi:acyl-CoA synthetase (AMP-forming)/AMP-acid ligase II